jgi:hypothetical protein
MIFVGRFNFRSDFTGNIMFPYLWTVKIMLLLSDSDHPGHEIVLRFVESRSSMKYGLKMHLDRMLPISNLQADTFSKREKIRGSLHL